MTSSSNPGRRGEVHFEQRRIFIICDNGERFFDLDKLQSLKTEICGDVCVNIPVALELWGGKMYYKAFKEQDPRSWGEKGSLDEKEIQYEACY